MSAYRLVIDEINPGSAFGESQSGRFFRNLGDFIALSG
jgi:hypothetical protein